MDANDRSHSASWVATIINAQWDLRHCANQVVDQERVERSMSDQV